MSTARQRRAQAAYDRKTAPDTSEQEYAAGYAHGRFPGGEDGPPNPSQVWLDGWEAGDRARHTASEYASEMADYE